MTTYGTTRALVFLVISASCVACSHGGATKNNPDYGSQSNAALAEAEAKPEGQLTPSDAVAPPPGATTEGEDEAVEKTPAPDNSRVNARDRNANALSATDQSNDPGDIAITKQIRQAVIADDSLSFKAKNVKIITVNGKVTLRGPVDRESDRTSVEAAARNVVGATRVSNQLEVKR